MKIRYAWIILSALGACGGGGDGGGSGVDPRLARLDIYEAQRLRVLGDRDAGVMGMPQTDAAQMPTTGAFAFDGFVTIRVEADNPLVLYGAASISVTFDTADVSGQMDAFFGTDSAGQVVDYDGALTVDSGTVGGAAANDLAVDYAGRLTTTGETLTFDGTATGSFLGNPVAAIAAADLEAGVDHNGVITDATLLLVGEMAP